MNKKQIERLAPYLKGFSAKSKIIIFLLASNKKPHDIRKMSFEDVLSTASLKAVPDIKRSLDLINVEDKAAAFFSYPSGREYTEQYILSVLERSHKTNGFPYKGLTVFLNKIKS